jgi:hypothetical protein
MGSVIEFTLLDRAGAHFRTMQYKEAEVALLLPDYLFQYEQTPDHDVFIRSFEGIFLTDDAERSGLPSTDCLENFPNGGDASPTQSRWSSPWTMANLR